MSTRNQIIKAYKNCADLAKAKKALKRQITVLEKKKERLSGNLREALAVDEIYKGVPLSTRFGGVSEVGSTHSRYAEIYKNAHNKKTFGGSLREQHDTRRAGFLNGILWLGKYWATRKELLEISKEWVAFGKRPTPNQIKRGRGWI